MERMPTILMPSAGESVRFQKYILDAPKAAIEFCYEGKFLPMAEHCMPSEWPESMFVVHRSDQASYFAKRMRREDVTPIKIGSSIGQADTVRQGMLHLANRNILSEDVLVINCDSTIDHLYDTLRDFVTVCRSASVLGGAIVFETEVGEDRYGFVDGLPRFYDCIERVRYSPFALAGIFYLHSDGFLSAFESARVSHGAKTSEVYLSEVLQAMLGQKVSYLIPKRYLHEWGTPESLMHDSAVTRIRWR